MTKSSIKFPINYHHTRFVTSAAAAQQLPTQTGIEIALVGRSNAGKSSMLNSLTGQKKLARTSKIPGRTQLINLFQVVEGAYLVDLPGYGYAQAPEVDKKRWQRILCTYLYQRSQLRGLVLLMDVRHPLKTLDQQMIQWAIDRPLPVLILLTKIDKLAHSIWKIELKKVQERVQFFKGKIEVMGFSSLKRLGVEQLQQKLDDWFSAVSAPR